MKVSLALCAIIGLLSIPFPFGGDQAMFMMAAKKLASGGVLYRDFWDFKQPGIYWFFSTGGRLFGYSEVGVHILEFLYMLLGSVAVLFILNRRLRHPWVASLAAVLLPIWYYGIATDWHRTQVEALAGVPLLICVAAFSPRDADDRRAGWIGLVAGVCSAVALIFKLAFLPLAVGPIVIYIVWQRRFKQPVSKPLLACYGFGLILPLAAVAIYFIAAGGAREAFDANFLYPGNLVREYPPASHFMRIRGALFWFLKSFLPLIVLAAIGVFLRPSPKSRLLRLQLVYWLAMGMLVIWVQWYSHWGYHFFLLFVPTLMLAAFGVDSLCEIFSRRQIFVAAGVIALSIVPILTIVRHAVLLEQNSFAFSARGRANYYAALSTVDYGAINQEVEFLRQPNSLPGDLLVIGNPLYYTLSGRVQSGVENGWAPDLMLAQNRQQVVSDIKAHPAAYVLIEGEFETQIIQDRFPDLYGVLQQQYEVYRSSPHKVWYRLRTH